MKKAKLLVLLSIGVLLISVAGLVYAHVPSGAAAIDPLYPVVGDPLGLGLVGTGYPYDFRNDPETANLAPDQDGYDIARNPNDVPSEPLADGGTLTIKAYEINTYLAPKDSEDDWDGLGGDVRFRHFAFGGGHEGQDQLPRVPAPFLRVKEGRTVTIILENDPDGTIGNTESHTIDFHAVVGKKGGAAELTVPPNAGDDSIASLTFTPENPGLFVYHCVGLGTPHGIAHHTNNGMYGLILVEPAGGRRGGGDDDGDDGDKKGKKFKKLTKNAAEFYVFQADIFVDDSTEDFDEEKLLTTMVPDHSVYNGRVGALVDHPLVATAGKNAVIYHGMANAHLVSFHIIGEIFDSVFDQGDILSKPLQNIQTITIPSHGAAVIVMDGDELVPTSLDLADLNILVDHSSQYYRKGALGLMVVCPIAGVC